MKEKFPEEIPTIEEKRPEGKEKEIEKRLFVIDLTEELDTIAKCIAEEQTANYITQLRREKGESRLGKALWSVIGYLRAIPAELSRSYLTKRNYLKVREALFENYALFSEIAMRKGGKLELGSDDKEMSSLWLKRAVEYFETGIADRLSRNIELGKRISNPSLNQAIVETLTGFIEKALGGEIELASPETRIEFNKEMSAKIKSLIEEGALPKGIFSGPEDERVALSEEIFVSNAYEMMISYFQHIKKEISEIESTYQLTEKEVDLLIKEHVKGILNVDIQLAKLASSIRTKIPRWGKKGTPDYTLSKLEEFALRLETVPILNKIVNPITVGLTISWLSESLRRKAPHLLVGTAIGAIGGISTGGALCLPLIAGAVTSGVFAYFRTKARVKEDLARTLREEARGLKISDPRAKNLIERVVLAGGKEYRMKIDDLLKKIKEGDEDAYVEALSRILAEFETRKQNSEFPQMDLLLGTGQTRFRGSFLEREELMRTILDFEGRLAKEKGRDYVKELEKRAREKSGELLEKILKTEKNINQFAKKQGLVNGAITGFASAVIGVVCQEAADRISATDFGQRLAETPVGRFFGLTTDPEKRITFLEYLRGQKPRSLVPRKEELVLQHLSQKLELSQEHSTSFLLPGGDEGEVSWDSNAKEWKLKLPEGWKREEDKLVKKIPGISGKITEKRVYEKFIEAMGLQEQQKKVRWINFADDGKASQVNSWEVPPTDPRFFAEKWELKMYFGVDSEGRVTITGPVGEYWNVKGDRWKGLDFLKARKMILCISPREKTLQHQPLVFEIGPGNLIKEGEYFQITLPENVSKTFFTIEKGKVICNGSQVTLNLIEKVEKETLNLVSIAAQYNPKGGEISIPAIELKTAFEFGKELPKELWPPLAIPPLIDWRTLPPGIKQGFEREPYFYYGGSYFEALAWVEKYGKRKPPRERKNWSKLSPKEKTKKLQQIVAQEREAIKDYLDKLDTQAETLFEKNVLENWLGEKNYSQWIEELADSLEPMSPKTRVFVIIPARLEGKNIFSTLENYIKQKDKKGEPLDPRIFEILVLVNRPWGEEADNTVSEIKRFKKEYPEFKVYFLDLDFPPEIAGVGLARKIASDIALVRSYKRKYQEGPLYIISEDADLLVIDKEIVSKVIEKFDNSPHLDDLRGRQIHDLEVLAKNDGAAFARIFANLWEYFRGYLAKEEKLLKKVPPWFLREGGWDIYSWYGSKITGGWNTAFRAEALALKGGYMPKKIGEDMAIGNTNRIVRSKRDYQDPNCGKLPIPNNQIIGYLKTTHVSSMRRFLKDMIEPGTGYGKFGQSSFEKEIRELSEEDALKILSGIEKINLANKDWFENQITFLFQVLVSFVENLKEAKNRLKFIMRGFDLVSEKDYFVNEKKEVKLTKRGVLKMRACFELFRVYLKEFGVEKMLEEKLALFPFYALSNPLAKLVAIIRNEKYSKNYEEKLGDEFSKTLEKFLKMSPKNKKDLVRKLKEKKWKK